MQKLEPGQALPLYMSQKDCAMLLGVGVPRIREMLYKGDLPGIKLGRRWIIPAATIAQWAVQEAGRQQSARHTEANAKWLTPVNLNPETIEEVLGTLEHPDLLIPPSIRKQMADFFRPRLKMLMDAFAPLVAQAADLDQIQGAAQTNIGNYQASGNELGLAAWQSVNGLCEYLKAEKRAYDALTPKEEVTT
jgi:excisionase family DNA binding protein